jgi:hypothetical protein
MGANRFDTVISGGSYFTEASLVDLDRHKMDETDFDEYDYSSDSDLDPEEAAPVLPEDIVPGSRKDILSPVEMSLDSEMYGTFPFHFRTQGLIRPSRTPRMLRQDSENVEPVPSLPRRMCRVLVVKSTAFKT